MTVIDVCMVCMFAPLFLATGLGILAFVALCFGAFMQFIDTLSGGDEDGDRL